MTKLIYVDSSNSGDNRPQFTEGRQTIKVPCCTLDSYVNEKSSIKHVDFLKIDIQGGEISAIEGATEVINHFRPLMMIEVAPEFDSNREYGINQYVASLVAQKCYCAYAIEKGIPVYLNNKELLGFRGNLFLSSK